MIAARRARRRKATEPERMEPFPGVTLREAREWLRQREEVGAKCPCCTQLVKVYRRQIHASTARDLIVFYRHYGTDWGLRPALLGAERDFAKLRFWGLIEESVEERQDGGRAGWWRVTVAGEGFVHSVYRVRQHALVYDNRLLRLEGPMVDIEQCLGKRFSYNELMGRAV